VNGPKRKQAPRYVLTDIQNAVEGDPRGCVITRRALNDAASMGFDDIDVYTAIGELEKTDFQESLPSDLCPGAFQDVYRLQQFEGWDIYCKVQMIVPGRPVVISFKPWGRP